MVIYIQLINQMCVFAFMESHSWQRIILTELQYSLQRASYPKNASPDTNPCGNNDLGPSKFVFDIMDSVSVVGLGEEHGPVHIL